MCTQAMACLGPCAYGMTASCPCDDLRLHCTTVQWPPACLLQLFAFFIHAHDILSFLRMGRYPCAACCALFGMSYRTQLPDTHTGAPIACHFKGAAVHVAEHQHLSSHVASVPCPCLVAALPSSLLISQTHLEEVSSAFVQATVFEPCDWGGGFFCLFCMHGCCGVFALKS